MWYNLTTIDYTYIQLYNLTMDPGERRNLAGLFPDAVEELKERIQDYMKDEAPLQCSAATFSGSFPIDTVPYYLPFDFPGGVIPEWATYVTENHNLTLIEVE